MKVKNPKEHKISNNTQAFTFIMFDHTFEIILVRTQENAKILMIIMKHFPVQVTFVVWCVLETYLFRKNTHFLLSLKSIQKRFLLFVCHQKKNVFWYRVMSAGCQTEWAAASKYLLTRVKQIDIMIHLNYNIIGLSNKIEFSRNSMKIYFVMEKKVTPGLCGL